MDLKCTGRARSRGGALAPLEAPQGPHAARREALERRGGMGFPPWGFLDWGAPRKGGFQGENQGGGREARPVLTVCRPTCITCPGGRGTSGAQAATVTVRDVAVDDGSTGATHEKKREAKRRAQAPGAPDVTAQRPSPAEHGTTACHLRDWLHLVQAVGSCGADAFTCITLLRAPRLRARRGARQRSASRHHHHCAAAVMPGASPRAPP